MSNVWFTSDLHLGHYKVAALRGFAGQEEHDAAIVEAWEAVVRKGDQVWVLGDLAVSSPAYALNVLESLPGEKHLIWGNHDQGHPMHRDAHRKAAKYLDVFSSAQAFARRRVLGREVLLSHFPYFGDTAGRVGDRHTQYRLRNEGLPLIHGHTHSAETFSVAPARIPFTPQLHVGLDAHNMQLVPLSWVEGHIRLLYSLEG
ncbi:metallophosphoesterase [Cellulosimicrobium sp. ES-005]|uniref:Metallophosphoesterase n=1 Tax=Cellulosimicrobium sp. ES-005 TaxID=3163031 RepID=A0AAU8FWU5_9MICO